MQTTNAQSDKCTDQTVHAYCLPDPLQYLIHVPVYPIFQDCCSLKFYLDS